MKLLPMVALAGFASLPLWPQEWRLALSLGWGIALAAETLLARRRRSVLAVPGGHSLLLVIVLGFLGRLALLALGAVVGASSGLYPEGPYLGAFLGGMAVGEALTLPGLAKAAGASRQAGDAESPRNDP